MCTYSMIIDHYTDRWKYHYPFPHPYNPPAPETPWVGPPLPSNEDLDDFKELLKKAKQYDKENNQKDCEMDEKKNVLKDMAKQLGVDISFIDKENE